MHAFLQFTYSNLQSISLINLGYSEKFCQDPFFGKQRMHGDNPNAQSFLKGTVSLRVQGSMTLKPMRGNCRHEEDPLPCDDTPIPKHH